jgi:Recombinase/Resolvase, N terminal domain/Recombinase zinc beta ribbon domain
MALEALAAELGGTIPPEFRYIDNGYSGDTSMRPHLFALRQTLAERPLPVAKLLIYDHDRLARETGLGIMLENEILGSGVELVYRVGGPRRNDRNSKFTGTVLKAAAEHNKQGILDQLYGGMLRNIALGYGWRSIPNYGYIYTRRPRRNLPGCFEFDPATQEYVVLIYEWILGGKSAIWVAKELTRLGAPLPVCRRKDISAKRPWNDAAVREIIHNPIYSGQGTFGRWERVEPDPNPPASRKHKPDPYRHVQKSSVRERPRDQWKFFPVPAYVTEEEQAQARAMLTAKKSLASRNTQRPYLLRGLLRCGRENLQTGEPCGRSLDSHTETRRKNTEKNAYHRCTRFYDQGDGTRRRCKTTIPAHVVEALVWAHVSGVLRDPALIKEQMSAKTQGPPAPSATRSRTWPPIIAPQRKCRVPSMPSWIGS